MLIAEDEEFLLDSYLAKFSEEDMDVKAVRDGQELLDVVESFKPDLIILDLLMPRKDGYDTLEALKTNKKTKHIPVIIASNIDQDESIQRGMKLGAIDYFVKSNISLVDLINKCQKYLKS